ncbi:type VI secretion system membrane subunit TssM [Paraburkholderia caffeinilytica]|uniref:type VI secretion system membrane subunit TssM n=1 Tax=Paraburkholderia caffeinilytica TaxID=1761016 RepID=UPI003DA01940
MYKLIALLRPRYARLLLLTICSLVSWFGGPLIGFGDTVPLASPVARGVLVSVLCAVVLLPKGRSMIITTLVVMTCMALWYVLPMITFRHTTPLASIPIRLTLIGTLLVLGLSYWLVRYGLTSGTVRRYLERLDAKHATRDTSHVDLFIQHALTQIRARYANRNGRSGFATRLVHRHRPVLAVPWYLLIGASGSGRKSAIRASGLDMSVIQPARAHSGHAPAQWWLSDTAIIIIPHGFDAPAAHSAPLEGQQDANDSAHAGPESMVPQEGGTSYVHGAVPHAPDSAMRAQSLNDADDGVIERKDFLKALHRIRPAPAINGAILIADVTRLANTEVGTRAAQVQAMRIWLNEIRRTLDVHCPIYILVTRVDMLTGFSQYFSSLNQDERKQPWGIVLPHDGDFPQAQAIQQSCQTQLLDLAAAVASGVNVRLRDESDLTRRRMLAAFAEEFSALIEPLLDLTGEILADSDAPHVCPLLRGIFFSSAMQSNDSMPVQRDALINQLHRPPAPRRVFATVPTEHSGYFLRNTLTKIITAEGHLAHRASVGHRPLSRLAPAPLILVLLLLGALAVGQYLSFRNNANYLEAVAVKTETLRTDVSRTFGTTETEQIHRILTATLDLPRIATLDPLHPDLLWRMGLYTGQSLVRSAHRTYARLSEKLLLPAIVRRIEHGLSLALEHGDIENTYSTLRVYLMLYDPAHFDPDEVQAWVGQSQTPLGSQLPVFDQSLEYHVRRLLASPVHPASARNDRLVEQARILLRVKDPVRRLYEQARASMAPHAPAPFTLERVAGPDASGWFSRHSQAPLSDGVPGLFTYRGYWSVFTRDLPAFVERHRIDERWLLGASSVLSDEKSSTDTASTDRLVESLRTLYLDEYVQQWDAFLDDIRLANTTGLPALVQQLRALNTPEQPLEHLLHAVVHETTLAAGMPESPMSEPHTEGIATRHPEQEIVDRHFADLRKLDPQPVSHTDTSHTNTASSRPDVAISLSMLLSQWQDILNAANTALSNNSMPAVDERLQLLRSAPETLPAPLRNILSELAVRGSREISFAAGALLAQQAHNTLGNRCELAVGGNYPFSPNSQRDLPFEDFAKVFAYGGLLDEVFTRTLAPYVDTLSHPWRYKSFGATGVTLPGPDLEPFQHARLIRNLFFSDQKAPAWNIELQVPELDPNIISLTMDVDGQETVYAHGPVTPFHTTWPGPHGGAYMHLIARLANQSDSVTVAADGQWAPMRVLQQARATRPGTLGHMLATFVADGHDAVLDISGPLTSRVLQTFRCPTFTTNVIFPSLPDSGPPPGLPQAWTTPVMPPRHDE